MYELIVQITLSAFWTDPVPSIIQVSHFSVKKKPFVLKHLVFFCLFKTKCRDFIQSVLAAYA